MKINFDVKTDKINNVDEYFFWLGQLSQCVCNSVRNDFARQSLTQLFLVNNKSDRSIINLIKQKIFLVYDNNQSNTKIENFEKILCLILEYHSPDNLIRDQGSHFLLGFMKECLL